MRKELLNPFDDEISLNEAISIAARIYDLLESAQDYSAEFAQLSALAKRPIAQHEALAAFGSVSSETFARQLMVKADAIPLDLTDQELIEVINALINAKGTDFQQQYWIACIERNTGNYQVSDLIYWPDAYFDDDDYSQDLSAEDILKIARNFPAK